MLLVAAERRHGARCREAGRGVRWQGDKQVQWPLLALLHPGHVVPGLSVSSGLAELRSSPSATLEDLIATVVEYNDSLEDQ